MSGWSKLLDKLQRDSGVTFTLHDLRRTVRTGMSRLGVDVDTAELAIGHAREDLEKIYNRDNALDRLRDAFDRWSAHVEQDTRYAWTYLFGAVCPERAVGAGLVMPHANTEAMNLHLAEIGKAVAPDAHAALVLDGAGWHSSHKLFVPDNITLVKLPP